jgi:hypothetical protein
MQSRCRLRRCRTTPSGEGSSSEWVNRRMQQLCTRCLSLLLVRFLFASHIVNWPTHPFYLVPIVQPQAPIKVGQVVLVQLLSATTAENYSAQAGHEISYVHDPSLEMADWSAPQRPALVLKVEWDDRARLYRFTAVAISRRQGQAESPHKWSIPITSPNSGETSVSECALSIKPTWPLEDSHCYTFMQPSLFYCLPTQVSANFLIIPWCHCYLTKLPKGQCACCLESRSPRPSDAHRETFSATGFHSLIPEPRSTFPRF